MYIKYLVTFITVLVLSTAASAAKNMLTESVLTPGARLMAGDLTKNEFFILDKDEPSPYSVTANKPTVQIIKIPQIVKNKNFAPRVRVAIKNTLPKVVSLPIRKAIKQVRQKSKMNIKMSATKTVTGLNRSSHKAASKKIAPSVKVVLKKIPLRYIKKKVTARVVQLNQRRVKMVKS